VEAQQRDNRARRTLWLVLPSVAVFALLWFLPPVAFWIAAGSILVAFGIYAGLQNRR
jgi:4-hydroxybenzoate polyprenyltransferase